ncbi:conserved hypothetical protein [Methylobacterium sp. 4-46]|uniref:Cj0069 family protein n=1 Tax=unclassified Methylobacterium TaxID=2615210 RepID=UPI000152D6BF|nr:MULTISPECIES: Cj0069 family protein [Methylobacterium]ACA20427.1 conserved hypothetical protein [Methylobacterium sp. 4-46]WFT79598.1 Cj0069 family protein [Methylobacterium nodulans]
MTGAPQRRFKVAVVSHGDAQARAEARPDTGRLSAIFAALAQQGIAAEPAVWSDALSDEVRAQLMGVDGVLVWVNPITTPDGDGRGRLDDLLREVAAAGIFVSAHPDVIAKMGTKEVLFRTRELGWGTDTYVYPEPASFRAAFPARVAAGPRVLKRNRGNGGQGVWKVERAAGADVIVQEAWGDRRVRTVPLDAFMAERLVDFTHAGTLVDQPFQARHLEGMVRGYLSGDQVVGFGHQLVRALAPPEIGPAGPRLYSGPDDPRFQHLRDLLEHEWVPQMAHLLGIDLDALPVIWDADFLLGPPTPAGEDTYVLCEINVSSVFPVPEEAPEGLAKTALKRLRSHVTACRHPARR